MGSINPAEHYWNQYVSGLQQSFLPWKRDGICDAEVLDRSYLLPFQDFAKLNAFAERHGFMSTSIMRTAWAIVLACYTGSDDLCFAVHHAQQDIVLHGLCHTALEPHMSIYEALTAVEKDARSSRPYLTESFDAVLASIQSPGLNEICNAAFVESNTTGTRPLPFAGSSVLALYTGRKPGDMHVLYNTTCINLGQAVSCAHTVSELLERIMNSALSSPLTSLDVVSEHDKFMFHRWNSPIIPTVQDCVHVLVERQVMKSPEKEAICAWDGSFTYQQISDLSNILAAHLSGLGVGPGTMVPLCFEKSKWYPVANLAVLKAGGACAALDPTHPPARIQAMVDRLHAIVAITQPKHEGLLADLDLHVVGFSDKFLLEIMQSWTNPGCFETPATPRDPAFVVFTSGSTGVPKAIIQSHESYCSSIKATTPIFVGPGPRRRHLQFASHTFDNCISDMFVPLTTGGCVCIPSETQRLDDLEGAIISLGANQAELTPTVAGLLQPSEVSKSLDTLALTGENATGQLIEDWAPRVRLMNIYGPAEVTIFTTAKDSLSPSSHPLDVGRPLGGHAWIVDPRDFNRLLPLGSVGELLFGGPFVSDGYLGDEVKSSAAFIAPPSWATAMMVAGEQRYPHRQFYLSGDLARFHHDGSIRLIGRQDTQVKLRGQRIELAGVEHCLNVDCEIRHAAVLFPTCGPRSQNLVAVLTLRGIDSSDCHGSRSLSTINFVGDRHKKLALEQVARLRRLLSDQLPAHMVPPVWIAVKSIPLLTSGKLDRKRLKAWVESLSQEQLEEAQQLPPEDQDATMSSWQAMSREQQGLVDACAHVLNLSKDKIDLKSSFIRLGGDSISAMALRARCLANTELSFSVRDVMRSHSLMELAACRDGCDATLQSFNQHQWVEQEGLPFRLSPIQQMFFEASPEGSNEYTQSILLEYSGDIDHQDLCNSIEALVKRHSMLRALFRQRQDGGGWEQIIPPYKPRAYGFSTHIFDHASQLPQILCEIRSHLNIATGPVFHVSILESSSLTRPLVYLTAHHLVMDLVSWRIILHDLEDITGAADQHPASLSNNYALLSPAHAAPPSFQVWSQVSQLTKIVEVHRIERACGPARARYFWGVCGSNVFGEMGSWHCDIGEGTTAMLLGESNMALSTRPTDIMAGALIHAFCLTFPERRTPAFFCESHGRESTPDDSTDWSGTVGWFTSMFPVRIDVEWLDVIETIARAKDIRQEFGDHGRTWFSAVATHHTESLTERMEVIFNYFGKYQQLERSSATFKPFTAMGPQPTEEGGPDVPRPALLELALTISCDRLRIGLSYNKDMKHKERLRHWITTGAALMESAAQRLAVASKRLTLSDVPLLPGGYEGLQAFVKTKLPALGLSESDIEDILPLGPMQQGIWMSKLLNPDLYNIRWSFNVRSLVPGKGITAEELRGLWNKLVDRHSILRTVIVEDFDGRGGFGQVVLRPASASTHVLKNGHGDLTVHTLMEQQSQEQQESFGSPGQPMHRLVIGPMAANEALCCCLHISHAVIDGSSLAILMQDLSAVAAGVGASHRAMPFGNYVRHVQSTPAEPSTQFWKDYLRDLDPCIVPRESLVTVDTTPVLRSVRLPINNLQSLSQFCRSRRHTITALLHAAWAMVLQTYTSKGRVAFGYLSSGRDLPIEGLHEAVGPIANMMICCASISRQETTGLRLIQEIQNDMQESMSHQTLSLGQVQQLASRTTGQSLFNTVVTQEVVYETDIQDSKSGLAIEVEDVYDPTEYDLTLHVWKKKNALSVEFRFWDSRFSEQHILSIAHALVKTLSNIIRHPDVPIGRLSVCSAYDLQHIRAWRHPEPTPADSCIPDMVSRMVTKHPDAPSICAWDGELTFKDLDKWSGCLASHYLSVAPACAPERFVVLCLSKSFLQPVSMLAALKTGAAIVSIEPTHPQDRLRGIIKDVDAALIVCSPEHDELCQRIADGRPACVVSQHNMTDILTSCSILEPRDVSPSNPVYAVFTSGSTGKPKGVVTEHGAYTSNIRAQMETLHVGPGTRALQFASCAFDAHLVESLSVLAVGGCVCIPAEQDRLGGLASAAERLGANWSLLTPTMANLMLPEEWPSLRTLVCGGEALTTAVIDKWADRVHLMNAYGPSECSIISAINSHVTKETEPTNIGPGRGPETWIVDPEDYNHLAPIGAVGELLLGGPALARGYLNSPEKTAEAFVHDPAWLVDDIESCATRSTTQRFYKTGDLVRYNRQGQIIYLGRKDTQVKIHGQRLEIGEIEHQLMDSPHVREAAVFYPQTGPFRNTLVAIFSLANAPPGAAFTARGPGLMSLDSTAGGGPVYETVSEIREHVSQHLPPYMVPQMVVVLEKMPMSSSAKLDRKVLAEFLQQCDDVTSRIIAEISSRPSANPATDNGDLPSTVEFMRSLWCRVLNVPAEAIHSESSFLRSGGDSISALQLVALCRQSGLSASVHDVLTAKTLHELTMKSQPVTAHTEPAITNDRDNGDPHAEFPLSPIQKLFLDLDDSGTALQTQSFTLACRNALEFPQLESAVKRLVEAHGMLRARFSRNADHSWTQRILPFEGAKPTCARHAVRLQEDAEKIARQSRRNIDIVSGPVFTVDYFDIGYNKHVLFLAAHHLVVDLVSWRILLHDLEELLSPQCNGDKPPQSQSFRDWCIFQSRFAQKALCSPGCRLLPISPLAMRDQSMSLLWQMDGKANLYQDVVCRSFRLEADASEVILHECQSIRGIDPLDVFIAAVSQSFQDIFGKSAVIHLEGHGRQQPSNSPDVSRTVGWFTTISPVWVPPVASFMARLGLSRESRQRLPRNGWDFFTAKYLSEYWSEELRDLNPEITLNYHGRFQNLERQDGLFKPSTSLVDSDDDPKAHRVSLINVEVAVNDGQLVVEVLWNNNIPQQGDMLEWVARLRGVLLTFASTCAASNADFAALDFPLYVGDPDQLDHLFQGLPRKNIEDVLPCSPMQLDLLQSHRKGLGFYQAQWYWRLTSSAIPTNPDPSQVVRAWKELVGRHSILRTVVRFAADGETAYQVVLKDVATATATLEVDGDSPDAIRALKTASSFEYSQNTPWHRILLCQSEKTGDVFCRLDISHLLVDGTAMEHLLQDWITAFGNGDVTHPQTVSYREYISHLLFDERRSSAAYWQKYLKTTSSQDLPPVSLTCPQAYHSTFVGTRNHRTIPVTRAPSTSCLLRASSAYGATPATLYRAAWAMVLRAWDPTALEVNFGYLVYGRSIPALPEAMSIVGPLFNVLPCRLSLATSGETMREWVQYMHDDYMRGLEHHDYSLVEMLQSYRKASLVSGDGVNSSHLQKPFNTLVNYRRTAQPEQNREHSSASRNGQAPGNKIAASSLGDASQQESGLHFDEICCSDPMDYRFVLEVAQESDTPSKAGEIVAALSFWEPEILLAFGQVVADQLALTLQKMVEDAQGANITVEEVLGELNGQ